MAIINLKEFYPWYTHDEYIEVSDEVAAELRADKLYEAAPPAADRPQQSAVFPRLQ